MDPSLSERSLAAIAAQIAAPAAQETGGRATEPATEPATEQSGTLVANQPAGDRLTDLAAWWDRVGSGPAPTRVEELWPVDVAFDPPEGTAEAITWAIAAADRAIDGGAGLVLLSLPATTDLASPATLTAHLLGLDAVDAIGFPAAAGLSDISWMVMVTGVREGLRRLRGPLVTPGDGPAPSPEQLLERLDDRVLAIGCAVVLRCASRRTPLILDGLSATTCGVFAHQLNPASSQWWRIADGPVGASPLSDRQLAALRQEPLTRLGLRYVSGDGSIGSDRSNGSDGTGARIALSMIEIALARRAG